MQLFHHTNTSGFLQETLEKQKIYIIHLYISPISPSSTNENRELQYIKSKRNKEKVFKKQILIVQRGREDIRDLRAVF